MKLTVKFITNSREELDGIIAMVEKFGVQNHVPMAIINDVNLALDEILSNVISYGYDRPIESDITVQITLEGGELTTEIEDEGKAFNPLLAPKPNCTSVNENGAAMPLPVKRISTTTN